MPENFDTTIEPEEMDFQAEEMNFEEIASDGQSFFDFVETHEAPPEPDNDFNDDLDEETDDFEQEEPDPNQSEKGSKKRLNECLSVLELADTAISFGLCFLAGKDPKSRSDYQADDDYKKQMAEQMALCDWNPKVKPEYMLIFFALMAYGPSAIDAYKLRTAKAKAKAKAKKSSGEKSVVEMEIDPETGDFYDPADEVKSSPKSSDANECKVCGKLTKNKHLCSRECSSTAARAAKEKKKREEEQQSNVV
jgi:hypothetical protein